MAARLHELHALDPSFSGEPKPSARAGLGGAVFNGRSQEGCFGEDVGGVPTRRRGGECRLVGFDAESARAVHPDAAEVIDLWFREEAEHSRLLGFALRRVRGEFITTTFGFRWFNRIRCWFGAQFEMLVLLVVEIVSTGYYRIIQRHCGDAPIAAMCGLILRDEAGHIIFHRDRLAEKRSDWSAGWRGLAIHGLTAGCTGFLWLTHGRWLRTLGGSLAELRAEVRLEKRAFLASLAHCRKSGLPKGSGAALLAR
jgi:hypothetical protein